MKIKELIEKLKEFDGELSISLPCKNYAKTFNIAEIKKFVPKEYKFLKEKVHIVIE